MVNFFFPQTPSCAAHLPFPVTNPHCSACSSVATPRESKNFPNCPGPLQRCFAWTYHGVFPGPEVQPRDVDLAGAASRAACLELDGKRRRSVSRISALSGANGLAGRLQVGKLLLALLPRAAANRANTPGAATGQPQLKYLLRRPWCVSGETLLLLGHFSQQQG